MTAAKTRIVVQVSSIQKRAIARAAKRDGVSMSELLRRAAACFEPQHDDQEIDALSERVQASTGVAIDAVDNMLAYIEASNRRIAAMNNESR